MNVNFGVRGPSVSLMFSLANSVMSGCCLIAGESSPVKDPLATMRIAARAGILAHGVKRADTAADRPRTQMR
jgi:hypothetical protein